MSFNHENYCRNLLEEIQAKIDESAFVDEAKRTKELAVLADEFTDAVSSWYMAEKEKVNA